MKKNHSDAQARPHVIDGASTQTEVGSELGNGLDGLGLIAYPTCINLLA